MVGAFPSGHGSICQHAASAALGTLIHQRGAARAEQGDGRERGGPAGNTQTRTSRRRGRVTPVYWDKVSIKREMEELTELLHAEPAEPEPQPQPTYTEITTLSGHTDYVRALAIQDSKLYSGSYDNTIKVWSV